MTQIEELLRKTIGLDAESVGLGSVHRAIRLRMKSLGLKALADYEQVLERSRAEWNELVESVVVTETWFYRDPAAFAALVRLVLEEWVLAHPGAPVRVLSIACASGEEPYSLAMSLLDAGLCPGGFLIEGMDISARALAKAERGVYRTNSFRGKDLAFRDRYFRPSKEGFILEPAVRHCVRFYRGNLFGDDFPPVHASYDFIFCRNLLIYFDRPTQRRAIERIERLLAPSGVLFVGSVEQPLVLNNGFVSLHIPKASACRKADHVARRPRATRLTRRSPLPAAIPSVTAPRPHLPVGSRMPTPHVGRPSPVEQPDLEAARRLADAGRLSEAAAICEAHLSQSRMSAQAYYLLGLVRDARGDASALEYYRKALYLDPNHYESLVQMASLLQKNGDAARARAFRNRAQRVKAKV